MTSTPFRYAALAAAAFCSLASATDPGDNHRPPGPAHHKPMPIEERVVSGASGPAVKPVAPKTVTAVPRAIRPGGGDPRVTLNPQPIPPGRSKVKAP